MSAAATVARDTSRPLPFPAAFRAVFELAFDGLLWSRRSLVMGLLLGLPVLLGLLFRLAAAKLPPQIGGPDLYAVVVVLYYLRNALPLCALFYATALVADELEGKTLTYLLTRPVRRSAVFLGKFAAYLATTACLTLPALVLSFFLLAGARGWAGLRGGAVDLLVDTGVVLLALVAYGALFAFLGVVLRRPTIPGLLFLFLWEMLANLPGYMPWLTVTGYLRSLVRHRPPAEGLAELFGQTIPAMTALPVLLVFSAVLLAASAGIFSRREYVMEQ